MKKILIIVPDGGMLFESAGIADILMQANRLHPEGAREICYQVKLATTQPHQVIHGQSGLNLLADHRLHEIDPREPLDTIMITGRGQNPQEGMAVVDWLRLAAPHARRIVSICGGAMLLAQTGLLDGRRATTHWKLLETMQAEFPQIRVEGGPLYIQDEHIWTSGGVSSGFDLTLALVEEDYGFSLARDIAQDFVMYLRRPGGQLQFSRYNLQQTATQGPINDLLAWLLENLTADLSVDKLAEKVAMSPRNFTRVFTRETGASPARYVAEARLAAARQRLEQTHETLDRIAEQTGLSIVPYSSGAAKALGKVIPELDGRLTGYSLRVPVPVVSIVDLTVTLERDVTVEEVNNAFREAAAAGPLKGILGYSDEPLVSSDYQGDPRSSIIDGLSTLVIGGNMVKILAWYDNEWGFSNRLVDLALMMAKRES
nr:DJ-1/PfpI family protein [Klebsiella pneumoniae]